MAWQYEQNLRCPGCGSPRDEVWIYGDANRDPAVRERHRQMREQAQQRATDRLCVDCWATDNHKASVHKAHEGHPERLYGLHFVLEDPDD